MTLRTVTTSPEWRIPTALLSEADILAEAVEALAEQERLKVAQRMNEDNLRRLCRQYDLASGARGFTPFHLRKACEVRGLL